MSPVLLMLVACVSVAPGTSMVVRVAEEAVCPR